MNDTLPVPLVSREKILTLEAQMKDFNRVHGLSEPECPLTHHFAPGAYGREIFLPKDSLVVGKIHKHAHLNMIMKGKVSVATEEGIRVYEGPLVMVSKPGTKRVVYAHEDTIWVTVHLTQETDLGKIEDEIIAKSYTDYDAYAGINLPSFLTTIEHESRKELL